MCSPCLWNMAAVFWDPKGVILQQEIKKNKNQNRAAWFVTSNYFLESGSMTGILEKTKMRVSQEKEERQ